MKSILRLSVALVPFIFISGCTSLKDESGKEVGTCIGMGCLLRAAVGANVVDSKTGIPKGNIPLFSINPNAASSAVPPVGTSATSASGVAPAEPRAGL